MIFVNQKYYAWLLFISLTSCDQLQESHTESHTDCQAKSKTKIFKANFKANFKVKHLANQKQIWSKSFSKVNWAKRNQS